MTSGQFGISPQLYTTFFYLYSIGGIFVHQFYVRFYSFEDVQAFVNLATAQNFPITAGSDVKKTICTMIAEMGK